LAGAALVDWRAAFARLSALHEAQRRQVARALHDRIGQALAAIKMSAHLCIDEANAAQVRQDLDAMMELVDRAAGELRELERILRPPQLDSVGLEAALRAEARRRFGSGGGSDQWRLPPLPVQPCPEVAIACLRILHCVFDAIPPDVAEVSTELSIQDLDGANFSVRVRIAGDGTPDWQDTPCLALVRAMAASLGGVVALDPGSAGSLALRWVMPYGLPCVDHDACVVATAGDSHA